MSTASVTIDELLQTTSRTFALSIPLLPSPLDQKLTLSYLVLRIADTLEDADHLPCKQRQDALASFCDLLDDLSDAAVANWTQQWNERSISDDEHYNRLMRETPQVLRAVRDLDLPSRQAIVHHAKRSAHGMAEVLSKADAEGRVQLKTLDDLRQYCYYVAGIVGELITDLFVVDCDRLADSKPLQDYGAAFGEGLQLVNILKDCESDRLCGRTYLPTAATTDEVFDLAFEDLRMADGYVAALRESKAPAGYIAFCDAPVQLAHATLRVVREKGPGSKVSRAETLQLMQDVIVRSGLTDLGTTR